MPDLDPAARARGAKFNYLAACALLGELTGSVCGALSFSLAGFCGGTVGLPLGLLLGAITHSRTAPARPSYWLPVATSFVVVATHLAAVKVAPTQIGIHLAASVSAALAVLAAFVLLTNERARRQGS